MAESQVELDRALARTPAAGEDAHTVEKDAALPCRTPDHVEGLHYHYSDFRGCGLTPHCRPDPSPGLGSLITRLLAEHWPDSGVNGWYLADLLRDNGIGAGS